MAKVMISLPDELLDAVDRAAQAVGDSRSRFVREALRARLAAGSSTPDRRREAAQRLRDFFERHPAQDDLSTVEWLRRDRERH